MKTFVVIKLLTCFIISVAFVITLFLSSTAIIKKGNDFKRLLPPHPSTQTENFDLLYNSFYFSGYNNDKVYLSNFTAPFYLIELNLKTLDTIHRHLQIKDQDSLKLRSNTKVGIYPPYFYIMDGATPQLYRGKLDKWTATEFLNDNIFFSRAIPISNTSLAIRTVSSKTGEYILGKLFDTIPYLYLNPKLLKKQVDGIFCTDGMLHYNRQLNRLLYLYHYRNQFIVLDTTMNLYAEGHTIDTNTIAKIKVADINQGKSMTMAAPPFMVNRLSTTYGNLLLVNSSLMADNETSGSFENASVIDVYHLQNKTYEFSFYIDYMKNEKLTDMIMVGDNLITIQGQYLGIHKLEPLFFEKIK